MKDEQAKFGEEFQYQQLSMPQKDGSHFKWHDVVACITPEVNENRSLLKAWSMVHDLAEWLKTNANGSKIENFRIIVGWSKSVREQQGQIFKIWMPNKDLDLIIESPTPEEFSQKSNYPRVPMPRWQKDVFVNSTSMTDPS